LVVQILLPFSRQPLAVRVARLRMLARSEPGLAHADTEEGFGPADARQVEMLLFLGAVLEDQRPALAVGDPVRGHGSAGREQFLGNHETGEGAALRAAVFLGQGQTEPAPLGQSTAETGVKAHPGAGAAVGGQPKHGFPQKGAHWPAQGLVLFRNRREIQNIYRHFWSGPR